MMNRIWRYESTPIAATPISRAKPASILQEISSSSSKRKLPPTNTDVAKALGSRSNKKPKQTLSQGGEGACPYMNKFFDMIGNKIPEKTLAKWDGMSLVDATKTIPLANGQSFFHYLKHGEEIVEAARGDRKLIDEVKNLKALIKNRDDEEKKFMDAN